MISESFASMKKVQARIHTHFQHDCMVWLCAARVTAQGFDYRDVNIEIDP